MYFYWQECVGMMLTHNQMLVYLDVSCNSLGKDYFSRCVGPALKVNTSLKTLRLVTQNVECIYTNKKCKIFSIYKHLYIHKKICRWAVAQLTNKNCPITFIQCLDQNHDCRYQYNGGFTLNSFSIHFSWNFLV